MATKLGVYNQALAHCHTTRLVSLVEAREARFALDEVYDEVLKNMLEAGFWRFAMRMVQIDYDATITPAFGYRYAHNKPEDWVKTFHVTTDEFGDFPLDRFNDEADQIFADSTPVFLRYVSNDDAGYGLNLTKWTARFTLATELELAWRVCGPVTGSSDSLKGSLEKQKMLALSTATSFEALREPTRRPQEGNWAGSRGGRRWGSSWFRYG